MLALATIVRDHTQETVCVWCGYPLYTGDTAYIGPRGAYCSRQCSHEHDRAIEEKQHQKEKQP